MVDTVGSTTTHTGTVPWSRLWLQQLGYIVIRLYLDEVLDNMHGVGLSLSAIVPNITLWDNGPSFWRTTAPAAKRRCVPKWLFDDLASCGLGVREGGVVGTLSTLEGNFSEGGLCVQTIGAWRTVRAYTPLHIT